MFRFEINGLPIPLPPGRKLDATNAPAGSKTAFIANGSYGEVDLYYQEAGLFILLYIHCSLRDQVLLHIRKTKPLPELDMSIHQAITILEKGMEQSIGPGHYTLRFDPERGATFRAPAGDYFYYIIYFPASTIKLAVRQYPTLTQLFIHTIARMSYQQAVIPWSAAMIPEWEKITAGSILNPEIGQPYLESAIKALLEQSFHTAFKHLTQRRTPVNTKESKMALAASIIDNAPHLRHSISSIARQVRTNPITLKQSFKKFIGMTVYNYIMERKLELVVRLLLETDLTEEAISIRLGYYGSQSLIRLFRKKFGITPRSIRAA